MNLPTRRWMAWVTVFALLFSQFAVAAYACPAVASLAAATVTSMSAHCLNTSDKAEQAELDNPTLCHQHCLQGSQHSDHGGFMPILPALGYKLSINWPDQATALPVFIAAWERALARTEQRPKSILHCCFRV